MQGLIDDLSKMSAAGLHAPGGGGGHATKQKTIVKPLVGGVDQVGAHVVLFSGRKESHRTGKAETSKNDGAGVTP